MAAGSEGISRDTLCRKWEQSVCNDKKWEGPLTERTFYRLRNELESIFNVNILCSNDGDKRYWVERTEHSVFLGMFCKLVADNSNYATTLQNLFLQVVGGMEISAEDRRKVEDIAFTLNKEAYLTLKSLIDDALEGRISGADNAQWAEFLKYHACFWLNSTFERIKTWVGVFIDRKGKDGKSVVRFFVVNESEDEVLHSKMIAALNFEEGERRDGHYWWFVPRNPKLRSYSYVSAPDNKTIISIIESLLKEVNGFSESYLTH